MLLKLLAAFILIPLAELYLLLRLADVTGAGTTILLVIVTGVIGSVLARREGAMAWFRFQQALAEGRTPSREIQDGLMIVFAAALLLTPGLMTDTVGFALLLPWGREIMRRTILARYVRRFNVQVDFSSNPRADETRFENDGETVDAEAVRQKSRVEG